MRALWSGSLSFGLINVPVSVYSASNSVGLDLDMLHAKDKSPIRYMRVCEKDGKEVAYDDIVKGYQLKDGQYVVLNDEDIKKAHAGKRSTIEIMNFAEESDIDTDLFEKPYFLEPRKGGEKAYVLLREALAKTKKVGIATFVLREREHLAVVKPEGNLLVLNQLRFKSELRDPKSLNIPKGKLKQSELKVATSLIQHLTEKFDPSDYHDTYTEDLKRVIKAKSKGKKVTQKGEERKPNADVEQMMKLLKESLRTGRKHDTASVRSR